MMNSLSVQQTEIQAGSGTTIRLVYDEDADILELFFGENGPARGIELTDQIILRVDYSTQRAVSLTLLHFSILSEQTVYGPRSWRLDSLAEMPEEVRQLVLHVLTTPPVNQFLKLIQLQTGAGQFVPVVYVDAQPVTAYA